MKNPIYIIGAGGLGREIRAMLDSIVEWEVAGFYDDNKPVGLVVDGTSCIGGVTQLVNDRSRKNVVVALGDPKQKMEILEQLKGSSHLTFPTLVHPSATIMNPGATRLGAGSMVLAGCVLTTGISIGDHTLLNLNVTIGHDSELGNCCSVMPGVNIAGNVKIGRGVLVGSGVNIINNIVVGDFSKIGAGAAVIRNVRCSTTVVGVPARETPSS